MSETFDATPSPIERYTIGKQRMATLKQVFTDANRNWHGRTNPALPDFELAHTAAQAIAANAGLQGNVFDASPQQFAAFVYIAVQQAATRPQPADAAAFSHAWTITAMGRDGVYEDWTEGRLKGSHVDFTNDDRHWGLAGFVPSGEKPADVTPPHIRKGSQVVDRIRGVVVRVAQYVRCAPV